MFWTIFLDLQISLKNITLESERNSLEYLVSDIWFKVSLQPVKRNNLVKMYWRWGSASRAEANIKRNVSNLKMESFFCMCSCFYHAESVLDKILDGCYLNYPFSSKLSVLVEICFYHLPFYRKFKQLQLCYQSNHSLIKLVI